MSVPILTGLPKPSCNCGEGKRKSPAMEKSPASVMLHLFNRQESQITQTVRFLLVL